MNHQFVQEFDGNSLSPIGHPRELVLDGGRRTLEKNWMFFGDDASHAVHSVGPHRIMEASWASEDRVECAEIASTPWACGSFTAMYGELRGGAPPRGWAEYFSICHAVERLARGVQIRRGSLPVLRRQAVCADAAPRCPLGFPNPFGGTRDHPKLNPAVGEVIYPCGAVFDGDQWFISYGINDERCAVATISHDFVLASLQQERKPGGLGGDRRPLCHAKQSFPSPERVDSGGARPAWNGGRPGLACGATIAAAAIAAYCGTLSVPCMFDDVASIVGNPTIRHWSAALWPRSIRPRAAGPS